MHATPQQIETLDELQEIDRRRLNANSALDALPQRDEALATRKKKDEVAAKLAKIEALYALAESEMARFDDEDGHLVEKQKITQEKIDESKGDYRSVSSLTRDLEGMLKRRETLEFEMNKIDVKMTEIGKVRSQARTAVKRLEERERSLVEAYRREGAQLLEQMKKDDAARVKVAAGLPADLMAAYEEAVQRCGGVGVAHLDDGRCSACRNTIEPNRLLQIKHDAPISQCPHCHRLLVIA